MKITYGRTAYVLSCGAAIMDELVNSSLTFYADGSENFCTTLEDIEAYIKEPFEVETPSVKSFLKQFMRKVKLPVGDVIFSK